MVKTSCNWFQLVFQLPLKSLQLDWCEWWNLEDWSPKSSCNRYKSGSVTSFHQSGNWTSKHYQQLIRHSVNSAFKTTQSGRLSGSQTCQLVRLLASQAIIHVRYVSRPWHPINPVPLHLIASTRLPPIPLYVPTFSDYLYSPCIATDRWVLCLVCLPIRLLNMFPFMILVTLCSHPVILTNMIRLGESATNITGLTHRAAQAALVVGLPDSPSIAPYILQ